ncbi:hypothetical protein ACOJVU_16080 [Mycobacterium sp. THU-M104]|uniref:hypothetical protein n=1 Tax=Mycobacterium sp. THU-M104 TaxID=3410515 RepID=UPI003B9C8BF3
MELTLPHRRIVADGGTGGRKGVAPSRAAPTPPLPGRWHHLRYRSRGIDTRLAFRYMLSAGSAMRTLVGRLSAAGRLAAAATAATIIWMPAESAAECEPGQYWEPFTKACYPLGVGPQPLACEPGQWWDPSGNICRPLGVGPPGG